jgi:sugar diacid utilization regulator
MLAEIERRRSGMARHMARAVVTEVRWDASTGAPPSVDAIARAGEAGLDLFLATAREARPPTPEELRRVAQLGVHQARGTLSVDPVLAAYRIAARTAWNAIVAAWKEYPGADPEAMVVTADYVFTALDQVAAEVTRTYLAAREQHMQRGTRARSRFFHALISDTFDSELALQKQALAQNLQLAPGYRAVVLKLLIGKAEAEQGAELLAEALAGLELPPRTLSNIAEPATLLVLWPDAGAAPSELLASLQKGVEERGRNRRLRAGLGSFHPGLHGVSRSYLEAQQALDVGRRLRPEGGVHVYEEVLPHLLMTQNPLLAERYVTHHLGPLLAGARGSEELLATLEAYLEKGSLKATAEALHLHRHTVIYRLDKLRDLLGLDLDDPPVRHRLLMATDLRRLL